MFQQIIRSRDTRTDADDWEAPDVDNDKVPTFSDEEEANEIDPVLSSVNAARRDTLIARRKKTKKGIVYRFDVQVGGDDETVFFAI